MEISSLTFTPQQQQDFTSPPPPNNHHHQSMSNIKNFVDSDASNNSFVRLDDNNETNSQVALDNLLLMNNDHMLPVPKRAREESLSKSSSDHQEFLNNFLVRPDDNDNFDHMSTLYDFTNREVVVVGDSMMMNKEQALRVCSSSTLKRVREEENVVAEKRFSKSDDQEIVTDFARIDDDNETNSQVALGNLSLKRGREVNVVAQERISKSFDQQIIDGFVRIDDDNETKSQVVLGNLLKRGREMFADDDDDNGEEAISKSIHHQQRRLWVKNRSNAWWEQCNSPDFPEIEFKKAFRMGRSTFDFICNELESVVTKKDTMLRQAIPVRQRVAVCIWRLATGAPLREVSKRFGLGISTCHKLVLEVCTAIRGVLMAKFIQWPDDTKMEEIKLRFERISGIKNVGGSMYTTHVPIIAPKESVGTYFNKRHTERNQKPSYSVTIQGVVDCSGNFTDVCIGWPGSMKDDEILEKSALYERANRGDLKGIYVVGSLGFPLTDWILVPYSHKNLTWAQHSYNEKVNDVQGVAKEAFMRLKARWSCLQKRTEVKIQDLPVVLGACCLLHNVCEMRGEGLSEELRFDLFDDEVVPGNVVRSMNAVKDRDLIAHNLLHHDHSATNIL